MRVFTTSALGPKQSLTPEGFLLCHDVPIARTGQMLYTAAEIPSLIGANGLIRIERDELAVFSAATLASFEGKPVTDDHPSDFVTPENWRELAVGVVQNVRRGTGLDSDLLLADLLITDKDTIQAVRDGKREVSCGYDADYEQIEPGRGRQTNIIGNHVALVARGRCGSRCAIQDKDGVSNMTKLKDKILAAFTLGDKTALTKTLDELPDIEGQSSAAQAMQMFPYIPMPVLANGRIEQQATKTADSATLDADAVKKLVADTVAEALKAAGFAAKTKDADEEEEEGETKDEDLFEEEEEGEGTKDAAPALTYADVVARAEIIAPGFKLPKLTADAAADPKKTRDALCACQRRALSAGWATADGDRKKLLAKFVKGKNLDKMTADAVQEAFIGASELLSYVNNQRMQPGTRDSGEKTVDAWSKNGIDQINQQFWSKLGSKA